MVLQLLDTSGEQRLARSKLIVELSDIPADEVVAALTGLAEAGIVMMEGQEAWASSATRRLDDLHLICI